MAEAPPRKEAKVTLRSTKFGKVRIKVIDRINVDDVTLHLIQRELFRLAGGADPGTDINQRFIDFLVRERQVVR